MRTVGRDQNWHTLPWSLEFVAETSVSSPFWRHLPLLGIVHVQQTAVGGVHNIIMYYRKMNKQGNRFI